MANFTKGGLFFGAYSCFCGCGCSNKSGGDCSFDSSKAAAANYGWFVADVKLTNTEQLPTQLPVSAEFRYENSPDCGGITGGAQRGEILCCFCLSKETLVEIRVSGKVEQQQSGYDYGTLTLLKDGYVYKQVEISSVGLELMCEMTHAARSAQVTLPAGKYSYKFNADTRDGRWHLGMTHTFTIKKAGA